MRFFFVFKFILLPNLRRFYLFFYFQQNHHDFAVKFTVSQNRANLTPNQPSNFTVFIRKTSAKFIAVAVNLAQILLDVHASNRR